MTNTKTFFEAKKRSLIGKKVKSLRKTGIIPANIHGDIKKSMNIEVLGKDFKKLYQDVGDTGLIYLQIEGEKDKPVLVDDVTYDVVDGSIEHVVFKQVNLSEKITAEVPIEIIGEVTVPEAVLVTVADSVEVEALPADLPEKFEVDVSSLSEIGQSITFADLKYDSSLIKLMVEEEQLQEPIVLLQEQVEEVEEVEAPAEEETGEATAEEQKPSEEKTEEQPEAKEDVAA